MSYEIDIKYIDKAQILMALTNSALTPFPLNDIDLAVAAKSVSESDDLYFDYYKSRCLKVDLSGDTMRADRYDRDNGGKGAALEAIEGIIEQNHTD